MSPAGAFTPRLIVAAAACTALFAVEVPSATAAPATDDQGYVDSTARCSPPNTAVLFGTTDSSRVAICKTPSGQFEYRGVRLRDGAKLIVPASQSGDGFVADNDGMTYTVTSEVVGNQPGRQGYSRGTDCRRARTGNARRARRAATDNDDDNADDNADDAVAPTAPRRSGRPLALAHKPMSDSIPPRAK